MNKRTLLFVVVSVLVGLPFLGLLSLQLGSGRTSSSPMMAERKMGSALNVSAPTQMEAMPAGVVTTVEESSMAYDAYQSMPAKRIADTTLPPIMPTEGFTPGVQRTIIKNASLGLVVKDTRQAVDRVTQLITTQNGVVTAANIFEGGYEEGQIRADMTLRVPVEKLDATLSEIKKIADKVSSETITTDDRTEQKVDLEAQLKNLRATENQLLTIMGQAKTVEETLKVQTELSNVRSQIERLQAQLDNLVGDAAMSTVHLSISTNEAELPISNDAQRSFFEEIKITIRNTVVLYRQLMISGVKMLIYAFPLVAVAGVGYYIWKKVRK